VADLPWALLAALLILDLLFSTVRASLLNARLPLLMNLAEDQPGPVERTMSLLEKPRLRTSLRLGVALTHFLIAGLAGWIAKALLPAYWAGTPWMALLAALLAALVLLAVEHLIEGLILPRAERWALRMTGLARWIDRLLSPFSAPLMLLLGSPEMLRQRLAPVTEHELKTWVEEGQPEGSLEKGEREMIYSIFQFGDTLVREIMVPRIDVLSFDLQTPLDDMVRAFSQSGHSRVPVYEETVDNIVGLLYAKDMLRVSTGGHEPWTGQKVADLRSILRPAYFVPEAKKVDALLQEMQTKRIHMAVVVDEYGGVAGLVTLEDIVEEIVGEIRDEYDQAEALPYQAVGEGIYLFQGSIDLDDFNEVMDSHIDKDIADTLGGLVFGLLGRVPANGETVEIDGLALTVENVSWRRIRSVRASRLAEEPPQEPAEKPAAERRSRNNRRSAESGPENGQEDGSGPSPARS
jgi:putative hemolysin